VPTFCRCPCRPVAHHTHCDFSGYRFCLHAAGPWTVHAPLVAVTRLFYAFTARQRRACCLGIATPLSRTYASSALHILFYALAYGLFALLLSRLPLVIARFAHTVLRHATLPLPAYLRGSPHARVLPPHTRLPGSLPITPLVCIAGSTTLPACHTAHVIPLPTHCLYTYLPLVCLPAQFYTRCLPHHLYPSYHHTFTHGYPSPHSCVHCLSRSPTLPHTCYYTPFYHFALPRCTYVGFCLPAYTATPLHTYTPTAASGYSYSFVDHCIYIVIVPSLMMIVM